ncbi:MAG: hypothetical protein WBO08_08905 [Mycobacterium sp.]|nr:hypothetical protein [Mycobacterium sp.]
MATGTNVINVNSALGEPEEQPIGPTAPEAAAAPSAPEQAAQPRTWSTPKALVSHKQVDAVGRVAGKAAVATGKALISAVTAIGKAVAVVARFGARAVVQMWRAIEGVPAALQLLSVVAILMLLGIVGAIALAGTAGLICAIVVVPVCSVALGALGHRWFGGHGQAAAPRADARGAHVDASELQRSVTYVDKKLTVALNSLGSDRHEQAVIALFQAKTAVELALGTEQDAENHDDAAVQVGAYRLRPRIQPGSKSTMPESKSLAAS